MYTRGYRRVIPMYTRGYRRVILCTPWYIYLPWYTLPVYHPEYTILPSMPHWVSALHRPWPADNTLGSKQENSLGESLSGP